jgi:hypothetical protein
MAGIKDTAISSQQSAHGKPGPAAVSHTKTHRNSIFSVFLCVLCGKAPFCGGRA